MKLFASAQLFRGFADPTRLRILNALAQTGGLTGTALSELLKAPRARVARHLRYLYRSRLVTTRRHGGETLYALRNEEAEPIHAAVEHIANRLISGLEGIENDNRQLKTLKKE